jgi:tetratricopeptide (TPR) repeat protein
MAEQQEPIRRRVAFKIIKLGMDTKQVIARFEAERQALALMDHPNIAKVLDAGTTETGRPFFVMELVRGIKITDYCDQNHLRTEERLDLFVQICHAVQHAHQKGIIHRDIKPSNILVTMHDGKPLPKIIDFGIAKATTGQLLTDKTVFTAFEQFIGTPAYMSPEQAEMSTLDIDTRSDIYALGVLLYELLTGRTPFDQQELVAAGLSEMRRIIREEEPLRPSTRISTLGAADQTALAKRRNSEPPQLIHLVRGDLDWIVMKCLEKDRTRRYETANAVADDVVRHMQDEPVMARPPGRVYRLQKLVRRNKAVFAGGTAVVAALVIGLGMSTWLFWQEREARQQAVAAEQKAKAEAAKSVQVAQFLKDMLNGVGPSVARGRDTTMLREILDKTAGRVGTGLKEQPEVEAELRSTIGEVYNALGQYAKAEEMHRSALALRQALWGNMNINVADSLDSLAWALLNQGKTVEAEPLFQEALTIRTNLLGHEHVLVAASFYNLGELRYWQGSSEEAEHLFRQSLDMRRKLLGNENVAVAESLSGLSSVLLDLGRPDQAEAAAREALDIQTRVLPEDERPAMDTGLTQMIPAQGLRWALYYQGKLDERETIMRQQLMEDKKVLGPEHPKIVMDLLRLNDVLASEGKLDEAEATVREGLDTSRRTLGEENFYTADCLYDLGETFEKAGKPTEAETAFREALPIWHKLGNNAFVAYTSGDLAFVLAEQGKLTEAEPLYRESLDYTRQNSTNEFGTRVWLTIRLSTDVFRNQGRLLEAESLCRETLEAGRKLPPSSALAAALAELADVLRAEGKPNEAEPLYREGLVICRNFSPYNYQIRQWLTIGLTGILRDQGKLEEAESLYRETVKFERKLPSSNLARVLAGYADMLRGEGRLAEAEPLYREGLDLCRRLDPNNSERRQWLAANLALLLQSQGKFTEAELLYRESITNSMKAWPNDPSKWHWQVGDLGMALQNQGRLAESETFYREAVTNAAKVWPNDFKNWEWEFTNLVDVLQRQNKSNDVQQLRQEFAAQIAQKPSSQTTSTNKTVLTKSAP